MTATKCISFRQLSNSLSRPNNTKSSFFKSKYNHEFTRAQSNFVPQVKPTDPRFGSGPCKKRPDWTLESLADGAFGRSHRSKFGKNKLKEAIEATKRILCLPDDYKVGIVPASDTGAFEMAMWSLLGPKPIDCFSWESFGEGWAGDIKNELRLDSQTLFHHASYGELPDLHKARKDADIVFTMNGTTSGVRVSTDDWINENRTGLTLCDATSAVFAAHMPWNKLDVTTFSWQKVLGGEGGHGVIVLSPRAISRLESHTPKWPMPKIFRLTKKGKLINGIFVGETINTPSMLCVEDYLDSLRWAESIGGLNTLVEKSKKNLSIVRDWVESNPYSRFLAKSWDITSSTSICISLDNISVDGIKKMTKFLEEENVALDIGSYRDAPAGLRIWGGATVV